MKKNILIVILLIILAIVCAILVFQHANINSDGETSEPEPPTISSPSPRTPSPSSPSQAQNEPPEVPPVDPSSSSQAANRTGNQDAPEQSAAPYNGERAEILPSEVDDWIGSLPTNEGE